MLLLKIHLVKSIDHTMEVGCSLQMHGCGAGDCTQDPEHGRPSLYNSYIPSQERKILN